MSTAEGLRSRKRRLRRRAIEDAALTLFDAHGFAATTIDQIAAAADVSPRTFFHYFPSKEDVVLGDFDARLELLREALARRLARDAPSTALRRALLEVAEDYQAEREQILLRLRITQAAPSVRARSLDLQAQWEERIAATFAASFGVDPGDDPRPSILAAVAVAAMRIGQRRWLAEWGAARLPDLITEALDLFDAGTGRLAGGPDDSP